MAAIADRMACSEKGIRGLSPGQELQRFPYARLGPYVAHGGILIILLGGLLGALFGFRGSLTVPEGGESSVVWLEKGGRKVELDFRIRCNRFVVDYYPSGNPREYRSEVSLLDQPLVPALQSNWLTAHFLTCFLGYAAFAVAFGVSLLYP
jgi:hypothetical protein